MTTTPTTATPAPTSQSQPLSQTTQEGIVLKEQSDPRNRESIALWVLIVSIAAVFLISVAVNITANDKDKASQRVMDSTLPLYGTWVGTILAFYFSRNAFEAASRASDRTTAAVFQQVNSGLVPASPDNTLAKISLKSLANDLVFRQEDPDKSLQDVVAELESNNRYRTIVVEVVNRDDANKKYFKYVDLVYRINASAYLEQSQPRGLNPQGEEGNAQVPPTLKTYLAWRHEPKQGEKAQPIVVFLSQSATLADADAKLKETLGCRDVIVTTDGQKTSPVVAYVTDIDINEYK